MNRKDLPANPARLGFIDSFQVECLDTQQDAYRQPILLVKLRHFVFVAYRVFHATTDLYFNRWLTLPVVSLPDIFRFGMAIGTTHRLILPVGDSAVIR